ncbi:cob(I)yrinic acid a,c-diamide adenosyltransferase [Alginatibacterium sediminis]|uniref:Corrinoid adenosyltransferase n=1 Tax=Alginatibacterium sediminis TaxID=2164068 RepID=A0A420EHC4_9ALTE|nr:cob(I)yrinic acid a,c-diamide adenosyltransferase [Alginatibacterium sediminis]RKF20112.1 cob(I)yrinic acid a,c-diamide adenosyltransferase [Alginatibacterium sediminis]
MNNELKDGDRHQQRQQKLKEKVDQKIDNAQIERGLVLVITGNGKGKSSSAFGVVARSVGHGFKAKVVQFIKGTWACGERELLEKNDVEFAVMATGFTWETQNKDKDRDAALAVWEQAKAFLQDESVYVVVLDELTYMLSYDYIDVDEVIAYIQNRPREQSVVVTGRAAHRKLIEVADTVSEVRNVKHGFDSGLKARIGIDW